MSLSYLAKTLAIEEAPSLPQKRCHCSPINVLMAGKYFLAEQKSRDRSRSRTSRIGLPRVSGRYRHFVFALIFVICITVLRCPAAELKKDTVVAFDAYVKATETRMADELHPGGSYLYPDRLDSESRRSIYDQLRRGDIFVSRLTTTSEGHRMPIPRAMVHHWVGVAFIPEIDLTEAVRVAQDYGHRTEVYKPDVIASKLLWHEGNDYRIFLRLFQKKFTTVVLNSEYEIHWAEMDSQHAYSRAYSTKIAEAKDPNNPDGPEFPVGNDHGYLWRLYSYWRFEQKDGGVYMQCEFISLTRDIPFGFGWLIRPLVTSIPKQSLTRALMQTRAEIIREHSARK